MWRGPFRAELKVVAPCLMWTEAVLVDRYSTFTIVQLHEIISLHDFRVNFLRKVT